MTDAQEQSILLLMEKLISTIEQHNKAIGEIQQALKEIGVITSPDVKQNQI